MTRLNTFGSATFAFVAMIVVAVCARLDAAEPPKDSLAGWSAEYVLAVGFELVAVLIVLETHQLF